MKNNNYAKALSIKEVFQNNDFLEKIDEEYNEKRRNSDHYIEYNAFIMKAIEKSEVEGVKVKDVADLFFDGSVWDPSMFFQEQHYDDENENFDVEFKDFGKWIKKEMEKNISLEIVCNMPSTKSLVERLDEIT